MHGLQRCLLFAVVVFYGSVVGRSSKRIRTNHPHHSKNNRNYRPSRSSRSFPSLLSFLSSVIGTSVTSEGPSHVAALHRKLSVNSDAEDDDVDEDVAPSTPVPSISREKSSSSSKVDAKRDNIGHNTSNKIQVAKSKKTKATDVTAARTPSGDYILSPTTS